MNKKKREVVMKKTLHILLTLVIMLTVSRYAVRLVDATVQIDDNILVLSLFLIVVNVVVGIISYNLYRIIKQLEPCFLNNGKGL